MADEWRPWAGAMSGTDPWPIPDGKWVSGWMEPAWTRPTMADVVEAMVPGADATWLRERRWLRYEAVLLDFNGTLAETASGEEWPRTPADWQFMDWRRAACEALREDDVMLGVASNQGGVGFAHKGYKAYVERFLAQHGPGVVDLTFHADRDRIAGLDAEIGRAAREIGAWGMLICWAHPKADDPDYRCAPDYGWRKPGPLMLTCLRVAFNATPERTLYVGDRPEDEKAADAAGVDFMWAKDFFDPAECCSWLDLGDTVPPTLEQRAEEAWLKRARHISFDEAGARALYTTDHMRRGVHPGDLWPEPEREGR